MTSSEYFSLRKVSPGSYTNYAIPKYLKDTLQGKNSKILDYGCGFGQLLLSLRELGYSDIAGADINEQALSNLYANGIKAHDLNNLNEFYNNHIGQFDYIILSHVLEHIEKEKIIDTLRSLKKLLKANGKLLVMVPNAQSHTGCYWAYEDFTHKILFTSGSLYYVLKSAGFNEITFLDPDCLYDKKGLGKITRKFFLWLYKLNFEFWNRITGSSFHNQSEKIFTYEIKVCAKNAPSVD